MNKCIYFSLFLCILSFLACNAENPPKLSSGHIQRNTPAIPPDIKQHIPKPIAISHTLPLPKTNHNLESYTVVVSAVPLKELLFSLARDAKLNLDIDNNISGTITLNAINQTLPQILQRIARQTPIRYHLENDTLSVMADLPFIRKYAINYLNISRNTKSQIQLATEISSTGQGRSTGSNTSGGSGSSSKNSNSSTALVNQSENAFWESLIANINALLYSSTTNTLLHSSTINNNPNIIVHRETGIIAVRATLQQHKDIQAFIDQVLQSAQRQVLIEATIVEVTLSDRYQAGINWTMVDIDGGTGAEVNQNITSAGLQQSPFFAASYLDLDIAGGYQVFSALRALEQFGDVKVVSSPKVMVLNNQTALLKVVDNIVYFSTDVDRAIDDNGTVTTSFDTEIHTVPIGFVMTVTPFIDANDNIILNIRPTISRIIGTINDPNPDIANAGIESAVPIVQVREVESILTVKNKHTAIIGGLMQNDVNKTTSGVPLLSTLPVIGHLFRYQDDNFAKTELVIFIRPVVIKKPSDLHPYQQFLPQS